MHYGIAASMQAMQDSGLAVKEADAHRYGVAMGSGIGGISTIEANHSKLARRRAAQDFAVLRAGHDHQHDLRSRLDQIRLDGAELRRRHGLHDEHPLHRFGRATHSIRRRRLHVGRRRRVLDDAIGSRRLLRGASSVDAQRRPQAREPALGSRPRRIRAQRRRRLRRARRLRARQSARGAHLRRVRRFRHERRRLSHHRAAGKRAGRLSMHAQRHARRRIERRRRSAT